MLRLTLLVLLFVVVATFLRGGVRKVGPPVLSVSNELLLICATWHRKISYIANLAVNAVISGAWRLLVLLLADRGARARSKAIAGG